MNPSMSSPFRLKTNNSFIFLHPSNSMYASNTPKKEENITTCTIAMDPISTSIQLASTHWTGLVRFQPLRNAGLAKHMITRKFNWILHRLHADRTRRVSILHGLLHRDSLAKHLHVNARFSSHEIRSKQRNNHFIQFCSMSDQNLGLAITPLPFPYLQYAVRKYGRLCNPVSPFALHINTTPCTDQKIPYPDERIEDISVDYRAFLHNRQQLTLPVKLVIMTHPTFFS